MAEQLDIFKKDFESIKKRSDAGGEQINKSAQLMGQTTGIIKEGIKDLGLTIQGLKDDGAKGTDLKDFIADKDVKASYASLLQYLKMVEDDCKKMTTLKASWKPIIADYANLKKKMKEEIAKRKKAVSTKVGGNKSLPEMEKLFAVVDKYEEQKNGLTQVMYFEPEDYSQHKKEFESGIAKQIASTKEAKLSSLQEALTEQALNTRVLNGKVNRARALAEAVLKDCKTAEAALKARDQKALMTVKATVGKPMKELTDIAELYKKAAANDWLKSQIQKSKDKATIVKGMGDIIAMHTKARTELGKIANAKI